jgi:ferredoxin-NADP reductase
MERHIDEKSIHFIFFADELGIASVFPALKQQLAALRHKHVSLLYCSDSNHHIFRKELEILQAHFPSQLFVCYHSEVLNGHCVLEQEDIEAILNANTMQQMKFIVSGNAEFVQKVSLTLNFLGIENIQIQEQYFSE